jgi:hypothetical protein
MRRLLSLTLAGVGLFAPAVYAQLPGLVSTPLPVAVKAGRFRFRRWCSSPR